MIKIISNKDNCCPLCDDENLNYTFNQHSDNTCTKSPWVCLWCGANGTAVYNNDKFMTHERVCNKFGDYVEDSELLISKEKNIIMKDRIELFTSKDCIRSMYDNVPNGTNNIGFWAILKTEALKVDYRKPQFQLLKLESEFGCSPHASGNACYGHYVDGEKSRRERYNFIGIANKKASNYAESLLATTRITQILDRAQNKGLIRIDRLTLSIDLDFAIQAFNIDCDKLLAFDDFNFAHDILGIQDNVDRRKSTYTTNPPTIVFNNRFVPRCAKT